MLHRLYYHITWTTRNRARLIDARLARFLCSFLRGVARQERAHVLEIGMVATHAHLLVRMAPTTNLVRLVQRLKGGSSVIANRERHSMSGSPLRWAKGYAIHTVSPRALDRARSYLRKQPEHHAGDAIPGWDGDEPEYEMVSREQWVGPHRAPLRT